MFEIILPALIAGIFLSFITGPLGIFIVWRKMAYFGDTLSHTTLLGVVFGIALDMNILIASTLFIILIAFLLLYLSHQQKIPVDTLLGILAHSSLSIGIVAMYFIGFRSNVVENYLLGDILSISFNDLYFIIPIVIIVALTIFSKWNELLYSTISPELACADGINIGVNRLIFTLLLAVTIGISFRFVGTLVITALLIIPVAISRFLSRSPEQMAIISIIVSIICIILGFLLSAHFDTPSGPSIVALCAVLFFAVFIGQSLKKTIFKSLISRN